MGLGTNLAYRLYVIALPIWAAVTYAWYSAMITMTPTVVAGGWFVLAAYGVALAIGLYATREEAFSIDVSASRVEEFQSHMFAGAPLNLYLLALAVWGVVSAGWYAGIGDSVLSASTVGYGWYAVALYGAAVGLGLCVANFDLLLEAADLSASSTRSKR